MKLPEKTEGSWVTSFDPLTLQWRDNDDEAVTAAADAVLRHESVVQPP